jgi:N-acetylglucosaminyl-diphospho-decaprenol L-rhamnosyltransferase
MDMYKEKPSFDIIIVNWNSGDFLAKCLNSIYASEVAENISFKTWIVDNNSTDNSAADIPIRFPQANFIASPVNAGFSHANNLAGSKGDGTWIIFLNPDTELFKDTLDALSRRIVENPDLCGIAPKLINPDGSFQNFYRRFPNISSAFAMHTIFSKIMNGSGLSQRYLMKDFSFMDGAVIDQAPGAAMIVRRSILNQIGWFDCDLPLFFNDVALSRRLKDHGYKFIFLDDVRIMHHGGRSIKNADPSVVELEYLSSLLHYFRKYNGLASYSVLKLMFLFDMSIRSLSLSLRLLTGKTSFSYLFKRIGFFSKVLFSNGSPSFSTKSNPND